MLLEYLKKKKNTMFYNLGHTNRNYSVALPVKVCKLSGDMLQLAVSSVPNTNSQWSHVRNVWEWKNVSDNYVIHNSSPKKL